MAIFICSNYVQMRLSTIANKFKNRFVQLWQRKRFGASEPKVAMGKKVKTKSNGYFNYVYLSVGASQSHQQMLVMFLKWIEMSAIWSGVFAIMPFHVLIILMSFELLE